MRTSVAWTVLTLILVSVVARADEAREKLRSTLLQQGNSLFLA